MPTYDYECDACDAAWEMFQKMTDEPVKKCPECGKRKARRLFGTGAAIMFKGSGFYETDYRSKDYQKSAEADKKAAGNGPEKSSDSKSDTKSESSSTGAASSTSSSGGKSGKDKSDGGKKSGGSSSKD